MSKNDEMNAGTNSQSEMMEIDHESAYFQTAPAQYVNRSGALKEGGKFVSRWGKRALISGGRRALDSVRDEFYPSLDKWGVEREERLFSGDCTDKNMGLVAEKAKGFGADVVVGVGGGKALDTAKGAAGLLGLPVVTVPTIAATCAATTALSVVYDQKGEFLRDQFFPTNPNLVLIDPGVIARAPVKYLRSGIFDALSKWYEGRVVFQGLENPDVFSLSAITLAELLNDRLWEHAEEAVALAEADSLGGPLSEVIDLNVYLTGVVQSLGQITCRGAAAHAVHNGLTTMEESHDLLHGLKVGYGIVVQLFLEGKPEKEIEEVVSFLRRLGLEPSLDGLGLPADPAKLGPAARKAADDTVIKRMPFEVTAEMVEKAMAEVEEELN